VVGIVSSHRFQRTEIAVAEAEEILEAFTLNAVTPNSRFLGFQR
jgi:hypothetical protein